MADLHKHRCLRDGRVWEHDREAIEKSCTYGSLLMEWEFNKALREAHKCPDCGTLQYMRYKGPEKAGEYAPTSFQDRLINPLIALFG